MVRRFLRVPGIFRFTLFVVCQWLLCLPLPLATAGEEPPSQVDDAAQDGKGTVWVLCRSERGQLHSFDGRHWSLIQMPFKGEDDSMPLRFTALPDGAVACLWKLSGDRLAITRQLGSETGVAASAFAGKLQHLGGIYPHLFLDSHRQFWVSGSGPEIHRIGADGHMSLAYVVQPEQLVKATATGNSYNPVPSVGLHADWTMVTVTRSEEQPAELHTRAPEENYNTIYTTEDGRGRIWAWTSTRGTNNASLDGALVFDGEKVEQHRQFKGITGTLFSCMAKKDEKHMWVAARREGLFEVDIDTFEARHAGPEPRLYAFGNVQMIFAQGADWYAITDAAHSSGGDLWRLRDGKWTEIIPKLDESGAREADATTQRARLETGKGFLLRAFGGAPWFVSGSDAPARVDWQSNFTIPDARKIFRMKDGALTAFSYRGEFFQGNVTLPPKPAAATRVTELVVRGWAPDANGHVWTTLEDQPDTLNEWDGEHWLQHPVALLMQGKRINTIATDVQGRVWMVPNVDDGATAYYDTRNGKWSAFDNSEVAYKALRKDPPHFEKNRPDGFVPEYSPDGTRIAFRGRSYRISYFDGSLWRQWRAGQDFAPGGGEVGQPFFNAAGQLCVTVRSDLWQWDDKTAWSQAPAEAAPAATPASRASSRKPAVTPPEGCVTNSPESIAVDNQGTFWLTWQHKLYKAIPGACIEVFSNDEKSPFGDGRRIQEAWVDRRGNAFLKTGNYARVMIAPKSPPPKASVTVGTIEADTVTVQLDANPSAGVRFRWQLDDGPWQLTKEKRLALSLLANGAHTLSVAAVDGELQASPQATVKFEVKIDPHEQLAVLIKQLDDPDFAKRQLAVDALARQPATALPALKDARAKAASDQRWWIDVAIQEIERHNNPAPAGSVTPDQR